jgi:hypothetical protein
MVCSMAKFPPETRAALRPALARHRQALVEPRPQTARRTARRKPWQREAMPEHLRWQQIFLQVLADRGLEAALLTAGVPFGRAVCTRIEDETFREAVERIMTERMATAEFMLVDLLLGRLANVEEGGEKAALALWQGLRDDRRKLASRAAPERVGAEKAGTPAVPGGAEAARAAAGRSAEIARLISVVEARLAAAEARKAGS